MGDEPFSLSAEARPGHLTSELLARFEKIYATGGRQLRRWWKEGAPLHDPTAMPSWWNAHKTWGLPEKIAKAAAEAAPLATESNGVFSPSVKSESGVKSEESIQISEYALGEGEGVELQRSLVKALFTKLEKAYLFGEGIDVAQRRYDRAAESLRKLEVSDRASKKQLGELIPKPVVRSDIHTMLELLRTMRENMVRKVCERVPALTGELRAQVAAAILTVRDGEDRVFRNLKYMETPSDVADALLS